MNASPQSPASPAIPSDDLARKLVVARPEDASLAHVSVAGDTYTILVSGDDTAGSYCLIDMVIPPGGGPPPHRHDFEEMFTLSEGELTFHFRGVQSKIQAGATVNIPANAPHHFKNDSAGPARMLCMAAPAGLDAFFLAVGDRVASRTSRPPALSQTEIGERQTRAKALAAQFKTELLIP
jgi:quercetin dioxygenase-like cupin family protein